MLLVMSWQKSVPAMAISYAVFEFVKKTLISADARLTNAEKRKNIASESDCIQ